MNDAAKHPNPIPIRQSVMDAIKQGSVRMRPRWHFVLISVMAALGLFIVFLSLLYVVSLSIFFLRDSGALFAPSFGGRGWLSLLHSVSWLLMLFTVVFMLILGILARRYRFVYRKPLMLSVSLIFLVVLLGSMLIASTSFHRQMAFEANHHQLPGPLALAYSAPFRMVPSDVYHGIILATTSEGLIINDQNSSQTMTVLVSGKTRLPYGADFGVGSEVVVIGDKVASGTVAAFGVRELDQ